jgi:chemotaxis protein MotB
LLKPPALHRCDARVAIALQDRGSMKAIIVMMGCGAIAIGGCVSQGTYDQAVAETQITRAELNDKNRQLEAASSESDRMHAVYKDTVHKLQKQIDAGELAVEVRDGRMVLDLQNDVLFDTGRVDIKPTGAKDLDAVADILKALPDRQFQVAGHTDDVPIKTSMYPSNWELSTARAVEVIHYLESKGVSAAQLSASGYADVDPVASNATSEGRKQNRRLEITLQPHITEVVRAPK